MKKLYTAVATSTGGRGNGHGKTADGMLDLKIGTPKELGGDGMASIPNSFSPWAIRPAISAP